MKPTLAQLKKRPALWIYTDWWDSRYVEPRITMPNGDADLMGIGGWYYDSVISWHDFAIAEWEFVGWL